MIPLQAPRSLRRLRHKPMLVLLPLLLASCGLFDADPVAAADDTTTQEPDASPGCRAPDIRFNIIHPETTTDVPYAKFETTPGYATDDFTTAESESESEAEPDSDADPEFVEKINIDLTSGGGRRDPDSQPSVVNPYQIDLDEHHSGIGLRRPDHRAEPADEDEQHERGHGRGHDRARDHDHEPGSDSDSDSDGEAEGALTTTPATGRKRQNQNRKKNQRRNGGRRRLENDNGQSRGGRGSRYKRQVQIHYDPDASPETDKWSGARLAAEGDVYYVHIEDILKSGAPNAELRLKLHKIKRKGRRRGDACAPNSSKDSCRKDGERKKASAGDPEAAKAKAEKAKEKSKEKMLEKTAEKTSEKARERTKSHHRRRGDSHEGPARHPGHLDVDVGVGVDVHDPRSKRSVRERWRRSQDGDGDGDDGHKRGDDGDVGSYDNDNDNDHDSSGQRLEPLPTPVAERKEESRPGPEPGSLQRVKRKSGKTTGALSRPKGGGDSSSKTTSRKDKGIYDEEGAYSPVHPDEEESEEEEEEEEEVDIEQQFTEVSEIRFPGEIGPLGDRRLCKIRCVKGKWVGPLCATNEEDDNGNVKFQPLYKSCHVTRIPPHLLLSYRNISVNVGWDLPHGHSLQARCKDLGLYKLLGESRVLCSNGLWAPRMPSCVPTTLLTNFSDDSAPSIRIKISDGSGAFEPSGVLAVLPGSNINLDCMYPRARGTPEWTWTSWYMQYPTGWSKLHEEQNLRYRLTIRGIQQSDSGTFTCNSPRGLTNSIPIVVATSRCPRLPEPAPPLTLRLEGIKLGQRAMYRCPPGYRIDGSVNATCLASGNWSSPPPTCQAIQCPRLVLEDPHLSLVELNTSAWGRAVFKCQWGFRLSGPPGLECEPTGVWSGPVPRCRAIQCVTPTAPLNGRIGGTSSSLSQRRLTVGALVTFSCNEGHLLQGEQSIICTETGVWSHEVPFCKSQCPYPGDPANGLIAPLKFHYDSGDLLTVQCRPGFVQGSENGPLERPRCMPDGNWSGPVPQCHSYDEV